jgi:NAD kinase
MPGKGLLTADGQENLEIDDSYIVEITRAATPLRLVKSSKRSYFATLKENFRFPS